MDSQRGICSPPRCRGHQGLGGGRQPPAASSLDCCPPVSPLLPHLSQLEKGLQGLPHVCRICLLEGLLVFELVQVVQAPLATGPAGFGQFWPEGKETGREMQARGRGKAGRQAGLREAQEHARRELTPRRRGARGIPEAAYPHRSQMPPTPTPNPPQFKVFRRLSTGPTAKRGEVVGTAGQGLIGGSGLGRQDVAKMFALQGCLAF